MSCAKNLSDVSPTATAVYTFRGYLTPILICIGLSGNLIVLCGFSKIHKRKPSRFNIYIMWIAVVHSINLIGNALLDDFLGRGITWVTQCEVIIKLDITSRWACKILGYIPKTTTLMSNIMLVLFTIDRLLTIFKPITLRGNLHLNGVNWYASAIMIMSMVVFIPEIFYGELIDTDVSLIGEQICNYVNPKEPFVQYILYAQLVAVYITPAIVVTVMNIIILTKFRVVLKRRVVFGASPSRMKNELRRVKGHLALTSVFLSLTFPLVVVIILRQISDFNDHAVHYPAYADRLVDLSRLFSSFDAIICSSEFFIYIAYLPAFRTTLYYTYLSLCGLQRPRASSLDFRQGSSELTTCVQDRQ